MSKHLCDDLGTCEYHAINGKNGLDDHGCPFRRTGVMIAGKMQPFRRYASKPLDLFPGAEDIVDARHENE